MRKKKLLLNSSTSIFSQIINLISGFILPKLIIQAYGSEVNGLISSIAQFLTIVSLSEFGMTSVVQSSLYKVLVDNDNEGISSILASSSKFFRRIGLGLLFYAVGLCALYPVFVSSGFDYSFVALMVAILSINSIAQYLLGITNNQLLSADQKIYVINITNIITVILNTVLSYILIKLGVGILGVKFLSALIFLIRPCVSALYVKNNYSVDKSISYIGEPIKQKWNGLAQHFAYYVFTSTDIVVLTFFSNFTNISVYSVYALILNGLKQIQTQFENAVKPLLGEVYAQEDIRQLEKYFFFYEWFMQMCALLIFGCAAALIIPFVKLYTKNISDADYIVPVFAITLTLAYLIQCARNPYNTLIQAVGHYKQTQTNYIVSALLNLGLSVILVIRLDIIGVAIGTLVAALYQFIWQGHYVYKEILSNSKNGMIYKLIYIMGIFFVGQLLSSFVNAITIEDYSHWFVVGMIMAILWMVILVCFSYFFCRDNIEMCIGILKKNRRK